MKCNFIHIKLKDKNCIQSETLELFKASIGKAIINLNYNKKESSYKNLKIIYNKIYIKKNIGKMIYKTNEFNNKIKILNEIFITNNKRRTKIIINNKQYNLRGNIENKSIFLKIKIKFLDNIIKLNSMFKECKSLNSVHNFKSINTIYLKTIYDLFYGCCSLLYIDDISDWNLNKVNDISKIFYQCSSLESLPNISKWNINNVHDINRLFFQCIRLKYLPDISKWNISNVHDINGLFYNCSQLKYLPSDISNWNTSNVYNMDNLLNGCTSLEEIPDISKWNTSNLIYLSSF